MQFKSLLLIGATVASVLAAPTPQPGLISSLLSSINGQCLSDSQANTLVNQFKSFLTNSNRAAAVSTASALVASTYTETSDSVNVLAGYPEGSISFNGKQAFLAGVQYAPAIPSMTVVDIVHDCNTVAWQWIANGIGLNVSPVKGFSKFEVDTNTGFVTSNAMEFNSIAWGRDIYWTATPPASH